MEVHISGCSIRISNMIFLKIVSLHVGRSDFDRANKGQRKRMTDSTKGSLRKAITCRVM